VPKKQCNSNGAKAAFLPPAPHISYFDTARLPHVSGLERHIKAVFRKEFLT